MATAVKEKKAEPVKAPAKEAAPKPRTKVTLTAAAKKTLTEWEKGGGDFAVASRLLEKIENGRVDALQERSSPFSFVVGSTKVEARLIVRHRVAALVAIEGTKTPGVKVLGLAQIVTSTPTGHPST